MIKFNRVVRASILSLTLAGGLAFAGHALAYDSVDLSDAQAAVDAAQQAVDDDNGYLDTLDWQQADADAYWAASADFCHYWSEGYMQCRYDVEDWWTAETNRINQEKGNTSYQLDEVDQPALDDANDWYDTVANDQNGLHGVP